MAEVDIHDLILMEDPYFIILNKPGGWLAQSDLEKQSSLHSLTEKWCGHPLKVIHRIDRPSSGILVYAKGKKAAMNLSLQWKNRTIQKTYLAVTPKSKRFVKGEMDDFLWHNKKKNKSYVVEHKDDGAKEALLKYQKLGEIDHYQLLGIDLITGRHHQIRCQLASRNLPIKGDRKYGAKRGNAHHSIHLHSWKLAFKHPETDHEVHIQAPPDLEDPVWSAFNQQFPNLKLMLTRSYY